MIAAVDRWLLTPAPATRLAGLRILVGGFAVVWLALRLPSHWSAAALPERQFEPVGPLAWLGGPLPVGLVRAGLVGTLVLGVAFVIGWRWRVVGPLFAVAFLAATTYRVSWGHVLHTDHLAALHVLVLGLTPAADAWSLDRRRSGPPRDPAACYGWPVRVMSVILVLTYVLAGWAKLRNGGMDWLAGDVLRNQVAYDNLRKILLGDVHSPVGGWVVRFGGVFPPLGLLTVLVELGAPLALLGGRWRTGWAVAAWLFHVGVLVLMAIMFPYPVSGIAYACLFPVEGPMGRAGRWARRTRAGAAAGALATRGR